MDCTAMAARTAQPAMPDWHGLQRAYPDDRDGGMERPKETIALLSVSRG